MMAETVEDLERRCWELGQKYSHIETINEVYRAEIDRLRDKVNRERGQHARDKEGLKRFHENMAENVKLDHTREMDKRKQDHEAEIGKLKGTLKEKDMCIDNFQKRVKCLEYDVAQLKLEHSQEVNKVKEDMILEMEKKLTQKDINHHDEMNDKAIELKELQDMVYKAYENLDRARVEAAKKLEEQKVNEKGLNDQTYNSMSEDLKKKEREFQRKLKNMDCRHKEELENLHKKRDNDLNHLKDQNDLKIKMLKIDHDMELESVLKMLNETQIKLEDISAEKERQMFEHENEMKIQMADMQRLLEEKFMSERNEKILFLNKDFEMRRERMEAEHDQQIARVKFQASMEEQKVIRANHLNSELEKKIKNLDMQLRKKDVHNRFQNLEDEAYMRDMIMAETYSTLRDSKQHNRGLAAGTNRNWTRQ